MGTSIVNDQRIANLTDRQLPLDGKFVVVFTEAADHIDNLRRSFWPIHIGNMMIGSIHSRTQEIDRRSIHPQIGPIGLLFVSHLGHQETERSQHKTPQLSENLDLPQTSWCQDVLIGLTNSLTDDCNVIFLAIRLIIDPDTARQIDKV